MCIPPERCDIPIVINYILIIYYFRFIDNILIYTNFYYRFILFINFNHRIPINIRIIK
jgi:hypothetical protein